ncbi:presequence protease, mitochondrial [Condylostylus longicornis]|uniref:presequence protease, mitochondrial n=1 Tax=Condylostylus longicornis TaxID=2530218 RepID=UPI00244E54BF|nr:presequence protease, mitochondrial [Condylostylus longicornis]
MIRRIATVRNKLKILSRRYLSANFQQPDIQRNVIESPAIITGESKFTPGETYSNFLCTRAENVPEFALTSYTFKHNKTGTELWYIDRDDQNNVFSINFRTTPFDSTGLPHILEHSVLCGSEKYPVRDPFFKMLNRSVATFMNAMTGPDYTLYPFSSMNEVDYRNLQKIYLDAVFKPNLEYLDFLQEGWRLEHSILKDKRSDYVIKGVVYNEMKGAFSDNTSIFGEQLLNSILPDHTYGFVSGGNPLDIPKLTHQNLVDFHKKYYHPSNARIYSYGRFDLKPSLEYIDREYLQKYDKIDNSYSKIPSQTRWTEPRNVHIYSRFDNMGAPFEKQNQISIAMLMSDITDIYENLVLSVLSNLLIRGPNSYFYKSLIEPNISGGYNGTTGYESNLKDTLFSVGLQDIKVDDFSRVQKIFKETIHKVAENGFEKDHIESVLHNIELSLKHQTPQFGLGLLFNMTPLWSHEGNVVDSLKVSNMIQLFRDSLKNDPKYLQKKIEQYFINNKHKLTLTMTPDDEYESKFQKAEQALLAEKVKNLTEDDKIRIYEDGLKLDESQKAPPNTELLPCLSIADVREPPQATGLNVVKVKKCPTQICAVPTNEISYLKVLFDSAPLTKEEIYLIPLFCDVINEMGTKKYDYRTFDKIVTSSMSGIGFKLHFAENIYDSKTYDLGILMTTHALDHNASKMFELCQELLCNFNMNDVQRFSMLLDNYLSSLSVGITQSGHLYAMQSCNGLVTDSAKLKSILAGVEHIEYMKKLTETQKPEQIMGNITQLGHKIFNAYTMRVAVNTTETFLPTLIKEYEKFVQQLPNIERTKPENKINLLEPSCQHFVMNIPVNYCAKAFMTVPYTHRDHPTLRLLAKYISAKYLLPVVREQNGAYGSGAKLNSDGIFNFFSYRDPNSTKTLDTFDNTYNWLKKNTSVLNEQTLFESKLGVLQQLDAPIAPGNRGNEFFLYGISEEIFRKYRQKVLNVTVDELNNCIEKYFKNQPEHYGKTILGPENSDIAKSSGNWKTITQNN